MYQPPCALCLFCLRRGWWSGRFGCSRHRIVFYSVCGCWLGFGSAIGLIKPFTFKVHIGRGNQFLNVLTLTNRARWKLFRTHQNGFFKYFAASLARKIKRWHEGSVQGVSRLGGFQCALHSRSCMRTEACKRPCQVFRPHGECVPSMVNGPKWMTCHKVLYGCPAFF